MVLPPLDPERIVLQLKSPMVQFCTKATLTTQVPIQLIILSLFHSSQMWNQQNYFPFNLSKTNSYNLKLRTQWQTNISSVYISCLYKCWIQFMNLCIYLQVWFKVTVIVEEGKRICLIHNHCWIQLLTT